MFLLREVFFLFLVCFLFFILMLLLYFEIRTLRKENKLLHRILKKYQKELREGSGGTLKKHEKTLDVYNRLQAEGTSQFVWFRKRRENYGEMRGMRQKA